jgi:hypothetical protein
MSSQPAKQSSSAAADEAFVARYLEADPAFFDRHPATLAKMQLPHRRGDATVSLVERQIEVLRDKELASSKRLAEFVAVARANEQLNDKIHRFTRRLLQANGEIAVLNALEASLREDFDVFLSRLVLIDRALDVTQLQNINFLRTTGADDPALKSFESLFSGSKPRCGQVRDSQREWLFGKDAADVASVALVPLGTKGALGLLVLASPERERFHPGMSTEYLGRMADLIADALKQP